MVFVACTGMAPPRRAGSSFLPTKAPKDDGNGKGAGATGRSKGIFQGWRAQASAAILSAFDADLARAERQLARGWDTPPQTPPPAKVAELPPESPAEEPPEVNILVLDEEPEWPPEEDSEEDSEEESAVTEESSEEPVLEEEVDAEPEPIPVSAPPTPPVARAASPPPAKPETPTMEVQNLDDDAILAKKREKAVEMVADELLGGPKRMDTSGQPARAFTSQFIWSWFQPASRPAQALRPTWKAA